MNIIGIYTRDTTLCLTSSAPKHARVESINEADKAFFHLIIMSTNNPISVYITK